MNQTIPLRLSYSSLNTLKECERKFQLDKLLATPLQKEESAHFSFGRALGAGVATYLATRNRDLALYECWLNYWPVVEMDTKSQWRALLYLEGAFQNLDTLLGSYEVAEFQGAPAVELSFKLNINEQKYFVGHIDVVLRHRATGKYFVLEVKTTGYQLLDLKPMYMHSGQAVGYSIALDRIVGEQLSTYGVLYFVVQLPHANAVDLKAKYHVFNFPKTLVDRLNWFVTLGLDVQHLEAMEKLNIFPKRGDACLKFGRPCYHFGTCSLQDFDKPRVREPDDTQYTFEYQLEELIEDHINRISQLPMVQSRPETILDLDAPL